MRERLKTFQHCYSLTQPSYECEGLTRRTTPSARKQEETKGETKEKTKEKTKVETKAETKAETKTVSTHQDNPQPPSGQRRRHLPWALTLILLTLSEILQTADSFYIPVLDTNTAYPRIIDTDSSTPVRWSSDKLAQLHGRSNAVRVSDRGIRFIDLSNELLNLSKTKPWRELSTPCILGPDLLCTTDAHDTVFPNKDLVEIPPSAAQIGDEFAKEVGGIECKRASSRTVANVTNYSPSLCDITQKGFDFIYTKNRLFARQRTETTAFYIIVSITVLVLVTCLAQNLVSIISGAEGPNLLPRKDTGKWAQGDDTSGNSSESEGEKEEEGGAEKSTKSNANTATNTATKTANTEATHPVVSLLSCVTLLITTFIHPFSPSAFVTRSDIFFQWFLTAYVAAGIIFWSISIAEKHRALPVNVMIGSLMLALSRLYDGAENPYMMPLIFLLIVRTIHKTAQAYATSMLAPAHTQSAHRELVYAYQTTIVFDCVLCALAHQYGFRPLYSNPYTGDAYFLIMVLIALALLRPILDVWLKRS